MRWITAEQIGQHYGLADIWVLRRGDQGQGGVLGQVAQVLQGLGTFGLLEFDPVAAVELLEAFRVVAVPLA